MIGKPYDAQTLSSHPSVTLSIVLPSFILIMNASITLNYEPTFVTIKISYVIAKLMLAPELETQQLPITK